MPNIRFNADALQAARRLRGAFGEQPTRLRFLRQISGSASIDFQRDDQRPRNNDNELGRNFRVRSVGARLIMSLYLKEVMCHDPMSYLLVRSFWSRSPTYR